MYIVSSVNRYVGIVLDLDFMGDYSGLIVKPLTYYKVAGCISLRPYKQPSAATKTSTVIVAYKNATGLDGCDSTLWCTHFLGEALHPI